MDAGFLFTGEGGGSGGFGAAGRVVPSARHVLRGAERRRARADGERRVRGAAVRRVRRGAVVPADAAPAGDGAVWRRGARVLARRGGARGARRPDDERDRLGVHARQVLRRHDERARAPHVRRAAARPAAVDRGGHGVRRRHAAAAAVPVRAGADAARQAAGEAALWWIPERCDNDITFGSTQRTRLASSAASAVVSEIVRCPSNPSSNSTQPLQVLKLL